MNLAQHSAWETIQRAHAIANGVFVAAVNRVGREGELTFWGQSFVADPFGRIIAKASSDQEEILLVPMRSRQDRGDAAELAVPPRSAHRRLRRPRLAPPRSAGDRAAMTRSTPAALGYAMPAEWHPHAATWLSWPKDPLTWPDRVPQVELIFLRMIEVLAEHETVHVLVNDEATRDQVRARMPWPQARAVQLHVIPTVDSWIRDYGPNFLLARPERRQPGEPLAHNAWPTTRGASTRGAASTRR